MKKIRLSYLLLLLTILGNSFEDSAQAILTEWASTVTNATVPDGAEALGIPDGVFTDFYDGSASTIAPASVGE